jgi:hypothetical protein
MTSSQDVSETPPDLSICAFQTMALPAMLPVLMYGTHIPFSIRSLGHPWLFGVAGEVPPREGLRAGSWSDLQKQHMVIGSRITLESRRALILGSRGPFVGRRWWFANSTHS